MSSFDSLSFLNQLIMYKLLLRIKNYKHLTLFCTILTFQLIWPHLTGCHHSNIMHHTDDEENYLVAVGESRPGLSEYTACKIAKAHDDTDLVEKLYGIKINSEISIQNGMLQNGRIKAVVEGRLRSKKNCGRHYDRRKKICKYCVRIRILGDNGLMEAIMPFIK